MKTCQFFTASHLIAMVLATVFSIGFASCSKDEDIEDVSQLSGTWKHEYTDKDGNSLERIKIMADFEELNFSYLGLLSRSNLFACYQGDARTP